MLDYALQPRGTLFEEYEEISDNEKEENIGNMKQESLLEINYPKTKKHDNLTPKYTTASHEEKMRKPVKIDDISDPGSRSNKRHLRKPVESDGIDDLESSFDVKSNIGKLVNPDGIRDIKPRLNKQDIRKPVESDGIDDLESSSDVLN
jgi:hypothetical protein